MCKSDFYTELIHTQVYVVNEILDYKVTCKIHYPGVYILIYMTTGES